MKFLKVKLSLLGNKTPLFRLMLIGLLWISCMGVNNMEPADIPLLVTDSKTERILPSKLRVIPDYHGIAGIVGSGQFNPNGLKAIVSQIQGYHPKKKIWLVDLRQETHFFANDQALSLYGNHNSANINKNPSQIEQTQQDFILSLQKKSAPTTVHRVLEKNHGEITKTSPILMNLSSSQSEKALAESYGLSYKRFYITDHHHPSPQAMAELVNFIHELDAEDWVIVHCRGGKGRTTTFMLLTALLKDKTNHSHLFKSKSLEDYVQEQIQLGGINLLSIDKSEPMWRQENKKNRADFVRKFYQGL